MFYIEVLKFKFVSKVEVFSMIWLSVFFFSFDSALGYTNVNVDKGTVDEIEKKEMQEVNDKFEISDLKNSPRWVSDERGDLVFELDYKIKAKLKASLEQRASSIYDNADSPVLVSKQLKEEITRKKIALYEVESGDTLKSIALKLYGNESMWKEIYLLNESKLTGEELPVGMKLKYYLNKE